MPEDPNFSHGVPERREQLDDVGRHESRRDTYQRYRGSPQIRVGQRLAVVSLADALGRLRQMNATSVQMVRAERGVARREVDLHLLGAAAAWGWSSGEQRCSVRVRAGGAPVIAVRVAHVSCGYMRRSGPKIASAAAL